MTSHDLPLEDRSEPSAAEAEASSADADVADLERRLHLLGRASRSITWEWVPEPDALRLSPPPERVFDFVAGKRMQTSADVCGLVHPEDRAGLRSASLQALDRGRPFVLDVRLLPGDGEVRWLTVRGGVRRTGAGEAPRLFGVASEVTERRRTEAALGRERERAEAALAAIADGVVRIDAMGRIEDCNPAAEKLTGWSAEEARGRTFSEVCRVLDEATRQPAPNPVEICLQGGAPPAVPQDELLVRRDGTEVKVRCTATLLAEPGGRPTGAVLTLRDLTELAGIERNLRYLATHDGHTGLVNRTEFERRLQQALARGARQGLQHAVLYLDLDHFKLVNDSCGHLAGDEMLKRIGSLLKCRFHDSDTLARLGGDEFAVLLENCSPEKARELAENLCKEIRGFRFSWGERVFSVGVSIGFVAVRSDSDVGQVLGAADDACYIAKEKGGNRFQEFQPDDRSQAERTGRLMVVDGIRKALEERSFVLYRQLLQPLVASGPELYEVFVRMIDAAGDMVPAGTFIPVAERHGLISAIDRWVVRATLDTLSSGMDAGDACFALNLSGQSIGEERFLESLLYELDRHPIPPERLCFEITETAAVSDLGRAMRLISILRGRGCRFILDDFGSGLSSFGYLRVLPVDFIKIDGQFVRGIVRDPITRALVESINHLGHVMQLKTVVEGVEDAATLAAVKAMRVDYAQGYHLGKPEPFGRPSPRRARAG
ncbi:MAG TPA: EAL domain-containing protein [Thermoanaerobaculia bacterium]